MNKKWASVERSRRSIGTSCNWAFRIRSSTVEPYRAATSSYNLFLCCVYSARQKPISCSYHCVAMSLCDIILCNNGISHNIHLCMNVYVRMYIRICICMFVHARSQCQDLYSLNDVPLTCSCVGCTPFTSFPVSLLAFRPSSFLVRTTSIL